MENKVGGYIVGTIVATFIGCIFLVSTMTGFLPYHEQTKQAQIWANAQVEMTEIVAEKEVELKQLEVGANPVYVLNWALTIIFILFILLLASFVITIMLKT